MVLTIKKIRRRNWSFLRPVPALWQLTLGALLLTAILHLVFGTLFRYRSKSMPHTTQGGELTLLNCGREKRWKKQLELRDPAAVTSSSGKAGFLAQLPEKSKPVLQQRPKIRTSVSAAPAPGYQNMDTRLKQHYIWQLLPSPAFPAEKKTSSPLVLTDAGTPIVFPEKALPAASAAKPSVWQVRSIQGIPQFVLLSSCGQKELDEASRIALAGNAPVPGNYLFYWTGGESR